MLERPSTVTFKANGRAISATASPGDRLSNVLRDELGLKGTKTGCDAGDCGACSVLIDGQLACACLVPLAQVQDATVVTIEGLAEHTRHGKTLQQSFLAHGAAQCGICTPGMLVSAAALLEQNPSPDEIDVADALAGVLCRCTGYRKIIDAVRLTVARLDADPPAGQAVGARIARLDGAPKVQGRELYGADDIPADAVFVRAVRSPHHRAGFILGDLDQFLPANPGLIKILTPADIPGRNLFGVIAPYADQPVFALGEVRFKGEAIAAVVGERRTVEEIDLTAFPVTWTPREPTLSIESALKAGSSLIHANRDGNVLIRGRVKRGEPEIALATCDAVVEGTFETSFIEHAYIEPEAGWARRVGDRIELTVSTQSPYLDRNDTAAVLGIPPENVRIIPSACGGGFGSKLDLSVQPFIALAAWHTGRPAAMIYTRPESIVSTTKRHPAKIHSRLGARHDGKLVAIDFAADFNTGAYASWGPTVANRVPVHASGPYVVPHYRAITRAILTNSVPAGAFRGFGVPQTAIAQEQLMDELAAKLGMDPLEFRIFNALRSDTPTVTGQIIPDASGFCTCLEALRPHWKRLRADAMHHNAKDSATRRGAGVAGMFYGCGNTSLPNPSTIRMGLKPDGRLALHQGAVDIGQGSNTVIAQIAADAVELPLALIDLISPDTDITPDCGKTSASRQTFVTGKAAQLAARQLRGQMLRLANAGAAARIEIMDGKLVITDGEQLRSVWLRDLPLDRFGYVLTSQATYDPPTTPLDSDGQGSPYAAYGFGAHLAHVEVDPRLGTVKVLDIVAAHDVGRAINPILIEGQIEGGIAQGLGMALMEEFVPGQGENLHDYLIPTIGDIPPVTSILIEDAAREGPYGAKGIGEQALIPTAPAILNAIHHAVGIRLLKLPATPGRIRAAIIAKEESR
jgi:CO/xanthine dehydrogenase Mo-binding subunit/aerobic-type carbon monoxide dehydrogenase small subunit (CoxS/CutS family)